MVMSHIEEFEYTIEYTDGKELKVITRRPHDYDDDFLLLMPKGEESNLFINKLFIKSFKWVVIRCQSIKQN